MSAGASSRSPHLPRSLLTTNRSLLGAVVGLAYFVTISRRMVRKLDDPLEARPSLRSLRILARPGSFTFVESAVRNAI